MMVNITHTFEAFEGIPMTAEVLWWPSTPQSQWDPESPDDITLKRLTWTTQEGAQVTREREDIDSGLVEAIEQYLLGKLDQIEAVRVAGVEG